MSEASMGKPDLGGRVALVTGAALRTGRALALALADAGADVIVHYHTSQPEAEAVASEIEALGRRALTVSADLTDPDVVESVFTEAIEALDDASRALYPYDDPVGMNDTMTFYTFPPLESDGVHATFDDWIKEWERFKAA